MLLDVSKLKDTGRRYRWNSKEGSVSEDLSNTLN